MIAGGGVGDERDALSVVVDSGDGGNDDDDYKVSQGNALIWLLRNVN